MLRQPGARAQVRPPVGHSFFMAAPRDHACCPFACVSAWFIKGSLSGLGAGCPVRAGSSKRRARGLSSRKWCTAAECASARATATPPCYNAVWGLVRLTPPLPLHTHTHTHSQQVGSRPTAYVQKSSVCSEPKLTVQHHLRVSALSAGHKFKGIIWPLGFNAYSVAVYVNPIACAKELGWRYAPPSKTKRGLRV
jgi:hypothetical protein